MVKRIVLMAFPPEKESEFIEIFNRVKKDVRQQQGCQGLELLKSETTEEKLIWTISLWRNEEDLETYRRSDLFKETWPKVKTLFSSKAQAGTLTTLQEIP